MPRGDNTLRNIEDFPPGHYRLQTLIINTELHKEIDGQELMLLTVLLKLAFVGPDVTMVEVTSKEHMRVFC